MRGRVQCHKRESQFRCRHRCSVISALPKCQLLADSDHFLHRRDFEWCFLFHTRHEQLSILKRLTALDRQYTL